MKKISLLSDYVFLLFATILSYRFTGLITTVLILLAQILLALLYHVFVTNFGTVVKAIPTINSSWLSIDDYNAKLFWRRRTLQMVFSYGVLFICVVVEKFICVV